MCGVALLAVGALELLAGRVITMPWTGVLGVACLLGGALTVFGRSA
jgi:hypothetical protein